jgi:cellobiose-specific phosphotransferase system component IIB
MTAAPRVFISYSWSSKIIVDKVLELSIRLRENGIEVIIDKWYLKEGQDKYDFMERLVKDPTIDKVLIMCDKSYAIKANDRKGGVGDETVIISPKVYGEMNQEKFLPVVLEKDENGKPYLPIYLRARIYFDLSNDETYESEYVRILRNLHQMPEYKMPPVGNIPEWLKSDTANLGPLNRLCKTISGLNNIDEQKLMIYCQNIIDVYRDNLEEFITQTEFSDIELMKLGLEKFIPLRNVYVDIFRTLCEAGKSEISIFANDFVCDC